MPPMTTRTGGNKKSGESRKTTSRCPRKGCGPSTDPMDIMTSGVEETKAISKPAKADATLQTEDESSQTIEPEEVHSTPVEADISHQGNQSRQYATDEETRIAAETLGLLGGTDDPNESPSKEEAYF